MKERRGVGGSELTPSGWYTERLQRQMPQGPGHHLLYKMSQDEWSCKLRNMPGATGSLDFQLKLELHLGGRTCQRFVSFFTW